MIKIKAQLCCDSEGCNKKEEHWVELEIQNTQEYDSLGESSGTESYPEWRNIPDGWKTDRWGYVFCPTCLTKTKRST